MFKCDPRAKGCATSYLIHWEQAVILIFYNNSKHLLLILTSNQNVSNYFYILVLEECLQHIKGISHGNHVSCSLKILLTCDIVQYFILSLRNKDCIKPRTIFKILNYYCSPVLLPIFFPTGHAPFLFVVDVY